MELTRFTATIRAEYALRAMFIACFALAFTFVSIVAEAAIPTPRIKPPAPNASQFLSDKDSERFRKGLSAAKRRQWSSLDQYINKINDPTAKDVLRWVRAARDPNVSFSDITYVVQTLHNWPRMTSIQAKAEGIMFDVPKSASKTLQWFRGKEPISGEGRAALARAHYKQGNKDSGDLWLKSAWRESKLTRKRQQTIFLSLIHI